MEGTSAAYQWADPIASNAVFSMSVRMVLKSTDSHMLSLVPP